MMKGALEKFDQLSRRERLLVAVTLLVFIVAVFFVFLLEPLYKAQGSSRLQIEQAERTLSNREIEKNALIQAKAADPSSAVRKELQSLIQQDKQLTAELSRQSVFLTDPSQMTSVLETVLEKSPGITLQKLTSLPVEPLKLAVSSVQTLHNQENISPPAPVYQHRFELHIRGEYQDIYDYLLRLESLSSAFFWDVLEYRVNKHPEAEALLRVYTISAEEGWLGG